MIEHILIIPDGNRRWAKKNNKNLYDAYKYALFNVTTKLIDFLLVEDKTRILSIYIISKKNVISRNPKEIQPIIENEINVFKHWQDNEKFKKAKIRFKFTGDFKVLPKEFISAAKALEQSTKKFKDKTCYLLVAYDAIDQVNEITEKLDKNSEKINILKCLEPIEKIDLIIRTGGEKRLSGAPLLQSSYAELFFINEFYPEINTKTLNKILKEFYNRKRRFGK